MKTDALKLYRTLRQKLQHEKLQLESRLREINDALGAEASDISPTTPRALKASRRQRGRPENAMSLREAALKVTSSRPLNRREIFEAVQKLGYVFGGKDPLNRLGVLLYGKNSPFENVDGKFRPKEGATAPSRTDAAPKRRMSAEAKKRIAEAQRKRWAKLRAAKKR